MDDSKRLSAKKRQAVLEEIMESALEVGVGVAWQDEIDEVNIRVASLRAMSRAVEQLSVVPNLVLVDGKDLPDLRLPAVALVRGGCKEPVGCSGVHIGKGRSRCTDVRTCHCISRIRF